MKLSVTKAERPPATAMAREIREIPAAARRLLARQAVVSTIADRIHAATPRVVVTCGRGSSGHVGVYLRYLFEARMRLLVSAAAPSVITAYRKQPDMRGALFLVISQSGRSPDLVAATQCARRAGALTLALVNDDASPVAAAADLVLPIDAGPERAVAATKTVVLSMLAGGQLVAALTGDGELGYALQRLPHRLEGALACDWSALFFIKETLCEVPHRKMVSNHVMPLMLIAQSKTLWRLT
jgi:glucosamine--fructose-6-phosphate aminotransferase (isomerizing)